MLARLAGLLGLAALVRLTGLVVLTALLLATLAALLTLELALLLLTVELHGAPALLVLVVLVLHTVRHCWLLSTTLSSRAISSIPRALLKGGAMVIPLKVRRI